MQGYILGEQQLRNGKGVCFALALNLALNLALALGLGFWNWLLLLYLRFLPAICGLSLFLVVPLSRELFPGTLVLTYSLRTPSEIPIRPEWRTYMETSWG